MLLNKGQLNGVRLLSPKTVELMATNHLPAGGAGQRQASAPAPAMGLACRCS